MRIALDTNVLIAAFISRGVCTELLEYCVCRHEVITSDYIIEEFRRSLCEKFRYAEQEVDTVSDLLRSRMITVEPVDLPEDVCADHDDIPVIGTAVAGKCRCLVTGDKALLVIDKFKDIDFIAPSYFWKYENTQDK